MKLEELLDHLAAHVLDDRADLLDGAPDSLYSDELLVRYLNEGQNWFCRKAWPIVDQTTPAVCEVALVQGQQDYSLHQSIVRVLSVTPADSDIPLHPLNWNLMTITGFPDFPDFLENRTAHAVPAGRPGYYSTDQASRTLRIRPKPDAKAASDIGHLKLRVARLPVDLLKADVPASTPEIPDEYHLALCDYAGGRALMQANLDEESRNRGKALIDQFFATLRSAKIDQIIMQKNPGRFVFGGWAQGGRE